MPVTDFRAGGDTQGVDLYWVEETAWGEVPAGPPTLNTARITGHTLSANKTTVQTQEVVGDAQVSDRIRTAFGAGGQVSFEFSLDAPGGGHLIDLIQAAAWGTFGADVSIGPAGVDAAAADNSFNDPLAAGTMFANVAVGQWLRSKAFTNAANNGICQVATKPNNNKITVTGLTLVNETGSGDEELLGQMLRNAKVGRSLVLEHYQNDLAADLFLAHTGMMVDVWEMTFPLEGIITGSLTMVGKERLAAAAATVGDGSPNARSAVGVSDTSFQMPSIRRNGAVLAGIPRQITLNANRGLRRQGGIGLQGAAQGLGLGTHNITGTVEAYLADDSLIDAHDQHVWAQLDWRVENSAGAALVFTLPQVVLASGGPNIPGRDQDVLETYNFETRKDATLGHAIQLDYLPV